MLLLAANKTDGSKYLSEEAKLDAERVGKFPEIIGNIYLLLNINFLVIKNN